jgi:Na+/H+ antiporter NhaD/arsenite permease-like protein
MIHLLWGRRMHAAEADRQKVLAMVPRDAIKDWPLLRQSLVVIGAVMLSFILAHRLHLEPGSIAMLGAAVLMMLDHFDHPPSKQQEKAVETFNEVEWVTIFFFIGLFMVVHGVDTGGLLQKLAQWLVGATGGKLDITAYAILWASAVLSAIVDNIPFVATMIPLIKNMAASFGGHDAILPLWWALSLGACLGGNGTLIGASANLTVAGIAERNGIAFRFLTYTLYAFPMMLVSVLISHIYIWLRYF